MTDTLSEWLYALATFDALWVFVKWFVLGVGTAFAYYVIYSLRRLRRNLHYIANQVQVIAGRAEMERRRRDLSPPPSRR